MAQLQVKFVAAPWFPNLIRYLKTGSEFDAYGVPVGQDWAMLPAKVRTTMIEVQEKNELRAQRQGLIVEVTTQGFFAINDHLVWAGQEYTIVGIDPKQDFRGESQWTVLTSVLKRGGV